MSRLLKKRSKIMTTKDVCTRSLTILITVGFASTMTVVGAAQVHGNSAGVTAIPATARLVADAPSVRTMQDIVNDAASRPEIKAERS